MKYKYYFRKPKSEIVKDILIWLLLGGVFVVASTSPYFAQNIIKSFRRMKKYPRKKLRDTFYNLKKQNVINFYYKGNQLYMSLTEKGKKLAGWLQIDALRIKKPKRWDGKWRIVMFDIAQLKKLYREVLRGKLKELGFQLFQKSVWIIPYDCKDEIDLLKTFFGLTNKEIKLIIAEDIDNDSEWKNKFRLQ
jgi:DNA-binding transcriptional regulator PaaX